MSYQDFLASKALRAKMRGLDAIPELAPSDRYPMSCGYSVVMCWPCACQVRWPR